MNNLKERARMVWCMEYIVRHINDEDLLEMWLQMCVADEDININRFSPQDIDCYYLEEDNFKELMDWFTFLITKARKDGGLYCGGVCGGEK